jgi:hypothetical protein
MLLYHVYAFSLRQESPMGLEVMNPSFLKWFYHSWYQSWIGAKHTLKALKITTMLTTRSA